MKIELPYFEKKIINLYKTFIHQNKKIFKNHQIIIYDHLNDCIFNGGRIHKSISIFELISFFKKNNFIPGFTLTNLLPFNEIIESKGENFLNNNIDVLLNTINKILKYFDQINLMIGNDELKELIAKNFNSKIIFNKSITSMDIYPNTTIFEKYDYIIPRVDLYKDQQDLLKYKNFLNKMIFLVSYECAGCPIYHLHYKLISSNNIDKLDYNIKKCFYKEKENFNFIKNFYNPENYNYQYHTSERFKDNIQEFINNNINEIGGIKIGRNSRDLKLIMKDLITIKDILEGKKEFL